MEQVAPGVYSLTMGRGAFPGVFPPNVYLVVGKRAALMDSGYEADAAARLRSLQEGGFSLASILISHPHIDHIGGAAPIRQATGALIHMHALDSDGAQVAPDRLVRDGDTLDTGEGVLEVIHTPGHTPGHICALLREKGLLFSGDHILGLGTTVITLPKGDMGAYMDSLRKLLRYSIQSIYPGHGPVVRDARRKIEELLQHRLEREEQVLSCLRQGLSRVEEMVREIYSELEPRLENLAREQVRAHLFKLVKEGRVESRDGTYHLRQA